MLKVLEFVRVLDRGGVETFIFNNLREMDRTDMDISFLVTRNVIEPHEETVISLGCNKVVLELKFQNIQVLKQIERLVKMILFFRKNHYDVIHFHSIGPYLNSSIAILAAKIGRIPVRIIHSHIAIPDELMTNSQKIKRKIGWFLNSRLGTHFVACSDLAAKYAYPPKLADKVIYIKNAANTEKFFYSEAIRNKVRSQIGIKDEILLGSVARLAKFKNHDFMLKIINLLCKEEYKFKYKLILIGGEIEDEPDVKNDIESFINKNGIESSVIMYGQSNKVAELLNAIDIVLMPSQYEGYPIVGIEAQCTGVKLIASDTITKELRVTENCYFISNNNAYEWIDKIVQLSEEIDSKDYNRKDMREYIKSQGFDTKITAKQLNDLYHDINGENF